MKNNRTSSLYTRRQFVKSVSVPALGAPIILRSSILRVEHISKPLNILFLMSDQHRGDCLGASGNNWIVTPNLDNLALEGVNFRKALTSVPSCTPARTAIFTGLSPWNHGMLGYMNEASQSYECEMPSLFSQNGYMTHSVGKNHFGPPSKNTHGYQTVELEEGWHSVIKGDFKCDYQKWFEKVAPGYDLNATGLGYTDHRGGISFPFPDTLHATYWTAERAIDFLKVSFQRPHPPFDPPKRWLEYYKNKNLFYKEQIFQLDKLISCVIQSDKFT